MFVIQTFCQLIDLIRSAVSKFLLRDGKTWGRMMYRECGAKSGRGGAKVGGKYIQSGQGMWNPLCNPIQRCPNIEAEK